jgi:hypothetical protein
MPFWNGNLRGIQTRSVNHLSLQELTSFALFVSYAYFQGRSRNMTVAVRQAEFAVRTPVIPTGRKPDAGEMHTRVMRRYPKVIARLGE